MFLHPSIDSLSARGLPLSSTSLNALAISIYRGRTRREIECEFLANRIYAIGAWFGSWDEISIPLWQFFQCAPRVLPFALAELRPGRLTGMEVDQFMMRTREDLAGLCPAEVIARMPLETRGLSEITKSTARIFRMPDLKRMYLLGRAITFATKYHLGQSIKWVTYVEFKPEPSLGSR